MTVQVARERAAKENHKRESAKKSEIIKGWVAKYTTDMRKHEKEKGQMRQVIANQTKLVEEWTRSYGFELMTSLSKSKKNQTQVMEEWIASRDNSTNQTAMLRQTMENLSSKTKNQELMIK